MELVMIFDMRAPDFGAAREQLFSAAVDMAEWADSVGFDVIGLGEHHSADDGYNPSPLILASAMASRTQRIRLRTAVLLAPCYDPIRLAEDVAILQIVSKGRFELGLGFAYRSVEFAMYGKELKDRFAIGTTVGKLLKRALRGESLEFEGRPCRVSPVPETPVPILYGGVAPKVARAAAREADGFLVPLFKEKTWQPYRDECLKLGKGDPGEYPKQAPTLLWISEDPDSEWEWLTHHILHVLDSYASWTAEAYGRPKGPYAGGMTPDTLKQSGAYQVLTPDQAIDMIHELGDNSSLYLTPLFGGADPERGWKMLKLFEEKVLPHVPRGIIPRWGVAN